MGQWEGQDVPLVRPSSCIVKGGIPSSRRYLPTCYFSGFPKEHGGGLAWIKSLTKDVEVTFSYSPLEYQLIKLVGPREKAQSTQKLPQKMLQTSN